MPIRAVITGPSAPFVFYQGGVVVGTATRVSGLDGIVSEIARAQQENRLARFGGIVVGGPDGVLSAWFAQLSGDSPPKFDFEVCEARRKKRFAISGAWITDRRSESPHLSVDTVAEI